MKTKLSPRFLTALIIFSLIGQVAWVVENMYFNVFIYKMFNASAADISNMVAASAVAATLTTVFMGALSDHVGKRKLFICAGYLLWGVSILGFVFLRTDLIGRVAPMTVSAASVGISLAIILDCVMTFFGSTANDAAFNAWLTDSTDNTNRGAAEGLNAMMPLLAILVVFGGFMFFDLSLPKSWTVIFLIIGILVCVIGFLGFFIIQEPTIHPIKEAYFKSVFYGFRPTTVKTNLTLYITLAAFVIFNISIQIFMPYLILYYEVSLGMANYVLIMAPAILVAAAVTAFWGKVYDKKGFVFSGLIAVLSLICGYVILYFFRSTMPVFVGSLLMMSGYLAGMAVFGALIRDYTPTGKSGMLQGVRIFSQVLLPGLIGPFIGKTVLANAETIINSDGTTSFIPNENIFLAALIAAVILLPFFMLISKTKKPQIVDLKTKFEDIPSAVPFSEYPRPMLVRDSYHCLNGEWFFTVTGPKGICEEKQILVPFPPESRISGVETRIGKRDVMHYRRKFTLDDGFVRDRVILHFGAVDQVSRVYINDHFVGEHEGGYLPFSFDITDALQPDENEIHVAVFDPLDPALPYGKQRHKRGGMWYTPISGIWQSVWLESVCQNYIEKIKVTSYLDRVIIDVIGGDSEKTIVFDEDTGLSPVKFSGDSCTVSIHQPQLWTPESPFLYRFKIISGADEVASYFALRTIDVKNHNDRAQICLNGKPYFFHGLLDQGYFSDGIYLPANEQGYKNDILLMKSCGFNMLRKHIKLEPEIFYYYCDLYGMVVFQDMINNGKYNFLIDTALPTIGLKRGVTHRADVRQKEAFIQTAKGIIELLYNHPSVCYYTIFNEGWGQFDADRVYKILRDCDPTRIYDTTSGWFKTLESDVESDHIYFKPVKLQSKPGKPMVLSEFGGYSCKIEGHSFNLSKTYGYRFFTEQNLFQNALFSLYETQILPLIENGLNAAVLTQVSDVEDETNGLLTYDREVCKVDVAAMKTVSDALIEAYNRVNQ